MLKSITFLRLCAVLAAAGGCAPLSTYDLSTVNLNPLAKPETLINPDMNAFYKRDNTGTRAVTAEDLIGPEGRCAFEAAAPPVAAAPAMPAPGPNAATAPEPDPNGSVSSRVLQFTAGPQAGNPRAPAAPPEVRTGPPGVALNMTECEVVRLAGYTDRVEFGSNERGQRMVTLTYATGLRAGIYRFVGGRLTMIERIPGAPVPEKPARPVKKKKTAKAKQPA